MLKLIRKVLYIIFILGLLFVIFIYLFGKNILYLFFRTTNGYNYLVMLLPFFVLFYLEGVLITSLQALDKQKKIFKISLISTVIKYLSLSLFIIFNLCFKSIIYAEVINIITVVGLCFYYLKKSFSYFY